MGATRARPVDYPVANLPGVAPRTESLNELATGGDAVGSRSVRKALALFGRAAPGSFSDVYLLNQRFDRADTLRDAREADAEVDRGAFTQALRSHRHLDDRDIPDIGTPIADIRAYFHTWADELDAR